VAAARIAARAVTGRVTPLVTPGAGPVTVGDWTLGVDQDGSLMAVYGPTGDQHVLAIAPTQERDPHA
jgi:hypothetical protein